MFQLFLFYGFLLIRIHEITSRCTTEAFGHYESCDDYYYNCESVYDADIKCYRIVLNENDLGVRISDNIKNIRNITFEKSIINIIPNSLFTKYKTVKNIYVNNSLVETIKSRAFHELANLETLYLQDNSIISFKSGTFEDLKSLTILNISNNHLTSLDDDIFDDLIALKILDISYNNLTNISTNLFANTKYLSELYLNHNNIDIKHEYIFHNLLNIKVIDCSNNNLHNFSILFFDTVITSLTTLKIGNNSMSFNKNCTFVEFPNIQIITLSYNKIYVNIDFSATVTYLDVSYTMLPVSVSSFENCTNLNELLLNNNNIGIIDVDLFASLSKLQNLQLQFNNIQKIPTGAFRNLHHLKILNLSFNKLNSIEIGIINGLENLEILNLANNQLLSVEISEFYSLRFIKMLNLDNNLLSTIDISKMFVHWHRANVDRSTTISIHNNRWKCNWLPEAIGLLQKNNVIVLRGNSFTVKNVRGIACIDSESNNTTVFKIQTSTSTPKSMPKTITTNTIPTTIKKIIFSSSIQTRSTQKSTQIFTAPTTTMKKYVMSDLSSFINTNTEAYITAKPYKIDIDYKYFDKYFSTYKSQETKDKSEEIWQVVSEIRGFQIFIIIAIIIVFLYYIQIKIVKKYKRKLEGLDVNNEIYSQSCNIELIDSNNE